MTDPARHRELKRLFLGACDLSGETRAAWLAAECADPDLRAEVERLIGATGKLATRALEPRNVPVGLFASDATSVELPRSLGPYRLEEVLGQGGMGIVYGALDTRLERRVALKQIPRSFASEASEGAFRTEMRTLATLLHPNIALVFALEEWEGEPVAALERVPGETLAARIARGPLLPEEMLPIAHQICRALEAAHTAGIVHLDLKPANVMVTPEGAVKVLDFGIARTLGEGDSPDATPLAGTPGYIAPELLEGAPVDFRADLYSFGALWFEALTGKLPFRGDTIDEWIASAVDGTIPHDDLPVELPDEVAEWVGRCLARDPEERPESMAEVRRRIDGWIAARHFDAPLPRRTVSRLPRRWQPLVGRRAALAALERALESEALVTVTAIGGGGKTRLALELAHRAEAVGRTVHWVELASVLEPGGTLPRIAHALGLTGSSEDLEGEILAHLEGSDALLVLDNCEHRVRELSTWLAGVLPRLDRTSLLATSRVPLGLHAESVVPLVPLDLEGDDPATPSEAFEFFSACAARSGVETNDSDRPIIETICARLDGIPLAIQLAAARLRVLPLEALSRRLDDRFRLLTGGAADTHPHQRTLRATLDWSHSLLDEAQKVLLRRLAVFADGFTLHAAEIVCEDEALEGFEILEALSGLVDHSLVTVVEGAGEGELRYRLLASVREYAEELFALDPRAAEFERSLLQATADFFVPLEPKITGHEQLRWLARLDQEQANLERVLEFATRDEESANLGLQIICAVWQGWAIRLRNHFGREWIDRLLPLAAPSLPIRLHAQVLNTHAGFSENVGDYDTALADYDRCATLCKKGGWKSALGVVLMNSAICIKAHGDVTEARRRYQEALETFREEKKEHSEMLVLGNLSVLDQQQGRHEDALEHCAAALALAEKLGDDTMVAAAHTQAGNIHHSRGNIESAEREHNAALLLHERLGDESGIARSLTNRSLCASERGDEESARVDLERGLEIRRRGGEKSGIALSLVNLAPTYTNLGMREEADAALRELAKLLRELKNLRVVAYALEARAHLASEAGFPAAVIQCEAAADKLREEIEHPRRESVLPERARRIEAAEEALGAKHAELGREAEGWNLEQSLAAVAGEPRS